MGNPSTRSDSTTELPPTTSPHKRIGHAWARALLTLVLLLATLIGVWFLGVRPSLHHQALMQVEKNWTQAMVEALQALSAIPPGPRNILVSERSINASLNAYHTPQSSDWQVTVTPANIQVRFTGCDQNCIFTAILEIGDYEQFQITHVQTQGTFALIMSNDELTNALNSNLQYVQFHHVTKITLLARAIDIQLH